MATIKAFIRTSKKTEAVNLRYRLSDGRDFQIFHTSNIPVIPDHWDNKKETIKAKVITTYNKREVNDKVTKRKTLISDLYEEKGRSLTSDLLDIEIDKKLHPNKYKSQTTEFETLFQYIERFIEEAPQRRHKRTGRLLSHTNIQQYKASQKHLQAFAKSIKRSDFHFSDININFYNQFVSYLQNLNFTQNTVGKHIRILKLMINEANHSDADTKNFLVYTEEVDNIYLNENELTLLKEFDFSMTPHLERTRDWFLLLAWTGSRFSDLEKIKRTDITNDFISFRQQKTNNKVTIPKHPVVVEILDKYNYQMPESISNQKFNEYIKDVCKKAGIQNDETITRTIGGKLVTEITPKYKLISSHTGRRSFCTNMYKRGLPTLMIMSVSGHTTEKSFLKYIKVSQEEHAQMMAKKWEEIYK